MVRDRKLDPVQARLVIGRRGWSAYQVFGVIGACAGLALSLTLAAHVALDPIARIALALVPPLAAVGSFMLGARGLGRRAIVFYEGLSEAQWISVLASAAVAAWLPTWWTLTAALTLALSTLLLAAARARNWWPALWLLSARHLAELDRLLDRAVAGGPALVTSEGLTLQLHAHQDRLELELGRDGAPLPSHLAHRITRQLGRRWTTIAVEPAIVIAARVAPENLVA